MKNFALGLIILVSFSGVKAAEVISVPENCFALKISPCLLRSSGFQELTNQDKAYKISLKANSIIKIQQLNPELQVEILQGHLIIQSLDKRVFSFKVNEVKLNSNQIFARTEQKKIRIYDIHNFMMSEYTLGMTETEINLEKADFSTKNEMVNFISDFYPQKNVMLSFLKTIEDPWQKEFKIQTESQTKVLQRSIASVEKAEKQKKLEAKMHSVELKNVRDLFFYRTFYR